MDLGCEQRPVTAGSVFLAPPGVPHAYLVTSETARTLVLITPGSGAREDFLRAAAQRTGAVAILGPPPFGGPDA